MCEGKVDSFFFFLKSGFLINMQPYCKALPAFGFLLNFDNWGNFHEVASGKGSHIPI